MATEELWLTTAPNPRSRDTGVDAGQRGWRLHAVVGDASSTLLQVRHLRSACGLLPVHGWGMDLFIYRRCARCIIKTGGVVCPCCHGMGMQCCSETGDARYMDADSPLRPVGLEVRKKARLL